MAFEGTLINFYKYSKIYKKVKNEEGEIIYFTFFARGEIIYFTFFARVLPSLLACLLACLVGWLVACLLACLIA